MINTRYEIIRKLGQGRSTVYLCRDIEFPEKELAIKILPPDRSKYEREIFTKELFTLQKLEHSNIIKAFDFGTILHTDGEENIEAGSSFITMEYFEGVELLSSAEPRSEKNLREITKQICAALYYLHQSKYIYYDLKPENILVSFKGGIPQIRLIDLGLAEYFPSVSDYEIKGTPHYIAPELLKKENHNHSVDLYSLGMILYQIVYNKFPFDAKSEMDIYKAAIEREYEFPPSEDFSHELIKIIQTSLEKDPGKRYLSALAVIKDLGFNLDISISKEFIPAKVYSSRDQVLEEISDYHKNSDSTEIYSIRGFEGVGKSSLLQKIQEDNNNVVMITNVRQKSAENLIRFLLRQVIFSESVYRSLSEEERKACLELLKKNPKEITNELRPTVALLTSRARFLLLINDFNLYDQFVSSLLLEVIPLLQVNNIKVIVSESSENEFITSKLNNVKTIILGSFKNDELVQFIQDSYYSDFPTEPLQKLIITNADLIPGNIKAFIKDLILFGVIRYTDKGVVFSDDDEKISSLTEAHFSIYDLRLSNLSEKELAAVKKLAALDIFLDENYFQHLIGLPKKETEEIIFNLQLNNIIQNYTSSQALIFTSEAIKDYIYASIEKKRKIHLQIAKKLSEKDFDTNKLEIARHFKLGGELKKCYEITMQEINDAESQFAFAYTRILLEQLLQIPLDQNLSDNIKIKLSEICYKVGDTQASLEIIKELKNRLSRSKINHKLLFIEASSFISSGEYRTGKNLFEELLQRLDDQEEINKLLVELAYANFELKAYDEARKQCDYLLKDKNLSIESAGRCYNLKGMIAIYQNNDLNSALENFTSAKDNFEKANQPARVAGAEVNIGNVYSIQKNYDSAEFHWKKASEINQSIGNLEQEGNLLQSIGTFYFYRANYTSAAKFYLKAQSIFISLGNDIGQGQILTNLGEVYLSLCEYQDSFNALIKAEKLFEQIQNYAELSDVLFIMGKLYFKIGLNSKLEEAFLKFNSIYFKLASRDNYELSGKLFDQWDRINKSPNLSTENLNLITTEFLENDDSKNFLECSFLLINLLIQQGQYDEAFEEVLKSELVELCSQNSILEAEREYFLGIISKNLQSDKLLPPLMYFEKAFELIKEEIITELTWKVLYEIAELYVERGNLSKAKHYVTYTRELIYLISERIESPNLRAAYLRHPERLRTLRKLDALYTQK